MRDTVRDKPLTTLITRGVAIVTDEIAEHVRSRVTITFGGSLRVRPQETHHLASPTGQFERQGAYSGSWQ